MNISFSLVGAVFCLSLCSAGLAAENPGTAGATPRFLGYSSCSSSSCHGGASDSKNQCNTWLQLDYHSRSHATLTTARSERLAEVLKLARADASPRCTVCHAPVLPVESTLRPAAPATLRGVSCEHCHGPAENWLRSHTRPDYTHQDRVSSGMNDLQSLYQRATTCVACHQTVEPDILAAGHPELIFELDGQSVTQPKHWKENDPYFGQKSWATGQAVALSEISRQLAGEKKPSDSLVAQWNGLAWLLQKMAPEEAGNVTAVSLKPERADIEAIGKVSDRTAQKFSKRSFSREESQQLLVVLASCAGDFKVQHIPKIIQARRAERLVLGIDRLTARLSEEELQRLEPAIQALFQQVQSLPDFQPAEFARALDIFSMQLVGK